MKHTLHFRAYMHPLHMRPQVLCQHENIFKLKNAKTLRLFSRWSVVAHKNDAFSIRKVGGLDSIWA